MRAAAAIGMVLAVPAWAQSPEVESAYLERGSVRVDPVDVTPARREVASVHGGRVFLEFGALVALDAEGEERWRVPLPLRSHWIGATEGIGFVRVAREEASVEVWRVDLASGTVLPELQLAAADLVDVLVGDGDVFAIAREPRLYAGGGPAASVVYVQRFAAGEDVSKWTRPLAVARPRDELNAHPRRIRPPYARSSERALDRFGGDVVACLDRQGPIVRLDGESGELVWRSLDRLWVDLEPSPMSAIVAGPVVVPRSRPDGGASILAAVAVTSPSAEDDVRCSLVTIDGEDGKLAARAPLPEIVLGWSAQVEQASVVWGTRRGMLRVAFVDRTERWEDRRATLDWYRRLRCEPETARFVFESTTDAIGYSSAFGYRTIAGGFAIERGAREVRFPVGQISLDDVAMRTWVLVVPVDVPFSQDVPTAAEREEVFRFRGWPPIIVSDVAVEPGHLRLDVAHDGAIHSLRFDLAALESP